MSRLASSEFAGFYPRDTRSNEQRADDMSESVRAKLVDPIWLSGAFGDITFDKPFWQLFANQDYIAFCECIRAHMVQQAETESAREDL